MIDSSRIAFKEWASVVEVLGKRDEILILRKGGIHEKGKKFDVAHEEFFLFPTFEHQNPKDLKPWGVEVLRAVLKKKQDSSMIPVRYYCVVQNSFWISDEKVLEKLSPLHIWSGDCIRSRFNWGDELGLFGIAVRTYALPATLEVPNQKRYGGCRSWVEFEEPISTTSLKPVLTDEAFGKKLEAVNQVLREYVC